MALTRNPDPTYVQFDTLIGLMEKYDANLAAGDPPFMKRLVEITGLDRSNAANQIRGQRRARLEDCRLMLDAVNQILGSEYSIVEVFPEVVDFRPDPAHEHRSVELGSVAFTPIRPANVRFLSVSADGRIRYTYTNTVKPTATMGYVLPETPIRLALDVAPTPTFFGKGSRLQYCWIP